MEKVIWQYQEHQKEGAEWAIGTIRQYGLAYLAWKERTRKTGAAILTTELATVDKVLVITKNKAIPGWLENIEKYQATKDITIINYESIHKLPKGYNPDMVILDEAHHAISRFPKPSATWKKVAMFTKGKPILYLSATPYAEHLGLIFNQFKLSSWTPFKHRNGYNFFRQYGVPHKTMTPYGLKETYTKFKDEEIKAAMAHLFDFKTRQDVGIEHEPTVNVIKVELHRITKGLMTSWKEHRYLNYRGYEILGDSDSKIRTVHYQLEGGTVKTDKGTLFLEYAEKADYIASRYDESKIAIMAHFVAERELLKTRFPNTPILSSDGDAEGVDLSMYDKLIIYSMSFKTSKHTQRIARQANHDRTIPIEVDILAADKPGVGYEIYKTVVVKEQNFNKNSYEDIRWQ